MIYIIYDTAINGPYTLMLLQNAYPVNQSLFKGTKDETLSDVAPYLFQVDDKLFLKINDPIASLANIAVLESAEKINDLLAHFQQFIYHKINKQENYFRFWDARVLSRFLPAAPENKLIAFFEGINRFYVLDRENGTAKIFYLKQKKLQTEVSALIKIFNSAEEELVELQHVNSSQSESGELKKTKRNFFN